VRLPLVAASSSADVRTNFYEACRIRRTSLDVLMKRAETAEIPDGSRAELRGQGDVMMRVMVLVKASKSSEAEVLPDANLLAEMGKFNEELVKAGVMLAGEGLHPSSKGARVKFSGSSRTVVDGPFAETKELVAGFWIWQVRSMEEAIEWIKRCPNPHVEDCEVEIRPIFEAEDFGALSDDVKAYEERLRAHLDRKQ